MFDFDFDLVETELPLEANVQQATDHAIKETVVEQATDNAREGHDDLLALFPGGTEVMSGDGQGRAPGPIDSNIDWENGCKTVGQKLSENPIERTTDAGLVLDESSYPLQSIRCIFAMSDLHTDKEENLDFIKQLQGDYSNDVLIVAGDISHMLDVIEETLVELKSRFAQVFFTPGNHELWLKNDPAIKQGSNDYSNSLDKLLHILRVCQKLDVLVQPRAFRCGKEVLWIVPVLSYHAQSFDCEPDIDERWDGIPEVELNIQDYRQSLWPEGLQMSDDSVADAVDQLNESVVEGVSGIAGLPSNQAQAFRAAATATHAERVQAGVRLMSFSHFVPRVELTPEKRILFYPNLVKAIGSNALCKRITQDLQPEVHVFGHTHFGWDQVLDGTRYLQAPFSMPRERSRLPTCAIGYFPDFAKPRPLLVHDGSAWAKRYVAGWSEYYKQYPREPWLTKEIQADNHKTYSWKGNPQDKPHPSDCFPRDQTPGWDLGPPGIMKRIREMEERRLFAEAERKAGRPRPSAVTAHDGQSTVWQVVGGADRGGILVRSEMALDSPQIPERLCTGAFLEELDLIGERLKFRRLTGAGPEVGWVSLKVAGKPLVEATLRHACFISQASLTLPPEVHELWDLFSNAEELKLGVRSTQTDTSNRMFGVSHKKMRLCAVVVPGNPFEQWGSARIIDPLYSAIVEACWSIGLPTVRFDYRGGGGGKGKCETVDDMTNDASAILWHVTEEVSENVVVIAHSSGNTAVAKAMGDCTDQIAAVVNVNWGLHPKALGGAEDALAGQYGFDQNLEMMKDVTGSLNVPKLFVKGERDRMTLTSAYEDLIEHGKSMLLTHPGELRILPGKHSFEGDEVAFAQCLRDFLSQLHLDVK